MCNFTNVTRKDYVIGVPESGKYEVVFNSDSKKFGGNGVKIKKTYKTENKASHGFENRISLTLPGMSVLYLKHKEEKKDAAEKKTAKSDKNKK